ncbi:exported hypothetical protein [uncultured Mycobacterium sp.]|uniref:Uncharacterized protein n=1 Tax=uncultured Mycobacterium sp. TaxID=171292 RepID=A0A1Y5PHQ3_9MYCO|nr:exported hypothetical protein [uncultured Mycobacterium sp.]
MRANIMSAWLCATGAEVAVALAGAVGAGDCAASLAELLHAPMAATAASATTALAKVLGLFTSTSLSSRWTLRSTGPRLLGPDRDGLVVL